MKPSAIALVRELPACTPGSQCAERHVGRRRQRKSIEPAERQRRQPRWKWREGAGLRQLERPFIFGERFDRRCGGEYPVEISGADRYKQLHRDLVEFRRRHGWLLGPFFELRHDRSTIRHCDLVGGVLQILVEHF